MTQADLPLGSLPQIGTSQAGDAGIGLVWTISNRPAANGGLGFAFRPQPTGDVGIDGHLEIITTTGEATGRLVGVQVKSGPSYFSNATEGGWLVYVDKSTVRYWRQYSVPVILVIVDLIGLKAFWVRVDKGDFPETKQNFKIFVPRAQPHDSSAVAALSVIAAPAPPSLLTQVRLSPELMAQEEKVNKAFQTASTADERRAAAQAALGFAQAVRAAGKPYEAAQVTRRAVRMLIRADEVPVALATLGDLLSWLLRELRDGDFALSMYNSALSPDTPNGNTTPLPAWPDPARVQLDILRAEAEALCGDAREALATASELRSLAATGSNLTTATTAMRLEVLASLAILASLASGDHAAAANAYEALSQAATSEEETSRASLMAMLHKGLVGDPAAQIESVRKSSVPESELVRRFMVLGWLRAESGDLAGAKTEFLDAAAAAFRRQNAYEALRALRNAARIEDRTGRWTLGPENPSARAQDLEPVAALESVGKGTHTKLMALVDSQIARGHWRQAAINIIMAGVRAFQDADLGALQDARIREASVWRGAAAGTPTQESILSAVRDTAATIALLSPDESERSIGPFRTLLSERLTPSFSADVWEKLLEAAATVEGTVGALKLAAYTPDLWRFQDRDARMMVLIVKGINLGWKPIGQSNGVRSTCRLVLVLSPPLTGAPAAEVRDALTGRLNDAPANELSDLLNAIAVTSAEATPPSDGGSALAERLLRVEQASAQAGAAPQWFGALAMSVKNFMGEPKDRLSTVLLSRARATIDAGGPEWWAVERAIAGGINVGADAGDRYLSAMTDLLDSLVAQAGTGSIGMGARDIIPLTRWASRNSSSAVRQRALEAAMKFLLAQGHMLLEQIGWIPFIAILARQTPAMLNESVAALLRCSRGDLVPTGPVDEFGGPFAFVTFTGHTRESVRAKAVPWLATLLPVLAEPIAGEVIGVLNEAANHWDPDMRYWAVIGGKWATQDPQLSTVLRAQITERVIRNATKDPVTRIALAALQSLD